MQNSYDGLRNSLLVAAQSQREELEQAKQKASDLEAELSTLRQVRERASSRSSSVQGTPPWRRLSNEIATFLSAYRPSVEDRSPVSLKDVILRMIPLCWSPHGDDHLWGLLHGTQDAAWYCFDQIANRGPGSATPINPEDELCEKHGSDRCLQVRADADAQSILFRLVGGGVNNTDTEMDVVEEESYV
ncbi:hypothetical protein GGS26DRAFT_575841 [Hypomontagnella submonticulosa]|nr:hypothetical protein GGS26DRAFT_575841 [Hypomontagnella submonticulosa]